MRTLFKHIIPPDDQVKSCIHTSRKDFKAYFAVACTYLASKFSRILPEKGTGSHGYRDFSRDTSNKRGKKRRLAAAVSGGWQRKKVRI